MCNACSRCCRHKIIRLNPYDVARLAARLGISTTLFLKAYACAGGGALRVPETGVCVFLNSKGCSVHPDRPLVCRLYPLARNTSDDGDETFTLLESDAECIGTFGETGTVADYLSRQDAIEPLDKVDRYLSIYERLIEALRQAIVRNDFSTKDVTRMIEPPSITGKEPVPSWLDMDLAVAQYCAQYGVKLPHDLGEKTELHMRTAEALIGLYQPGKTIGGDGKTTSLDAPAALRILARTAAILGYSLGVSIKDLKSFV